MIGTLLGVVAVKTISSAAVKVTTNAMIGVGGYMEEKKAIKEKEKQIQRQKYEMELSMYDNPNEFIRVRVNHGDLLNHSFQDVIKSLAGMGFYDINLRERMINKGLFGRDETGNVIGVYINGARSFKSYSTFPKDSYVVVEAIVHKKREQLYMPELEEIRKGSILYQRPVKRCAYCGVEVDNAQRFCIRCGSPL